MVKVHIVIGDKTDTRFRNKFVRKKGDYSKKIEELMLKEINKKKK